MHDMLLHCSDCGDERAFAPVGCLDGHDECPERACTECGAAVLLAGWLPVTVRPTTDLLLEALVVPHETDVRGSLGGLMAAPARPASDTRLAG